MSTLKFLIARAAAVPEGFGDEDAIHAVWTHAKP